MEPAVCAGRNHACILQTQQLAAIGQSLAFARPRRQVPISVVINVLVDGSHLSGKPTLLALILD